MDKLLRNKSRRFKRIVYCILLGFFLVDLGFTFVQHFNQPLDGDIASHVLPIKRLQPVFESPFGIKAIAEDFEYPNPNRFFCHWSLSNYLKKVPLLFHRITDPVNSIYLSLAIVKTLVHLWILMVLSLLVQGSFSWQKVDTVATLVLLAPLMQTNGFRRYMGIVDQSPTYTFFYALPVLILMIYFTPIILKNVHGRDLKLGLLSKLLWILFALIIALSSPINPGIVLVSGLVALLFYIFNSLKNIPSTNILTKIYLSIIHLPKMFWIVFVPVGVLSLYSLFLGTYNSNTTSTAVDISILYGNLPQGIINQFTTKLGFPILFAAIAINAILIRRIGSDLNSKKIFQVFKWIGLFSLIYILLLPLGGFREYRPNTLRFDTIIPITLGVMFMFGLSTKFILKHAKVSTLKWYSLLIIGILIVFTNADNLGLENNDVEKTLLLEISATDEEVFYIPKEARFMNWNKGITPFEMKLNAQIIRDWKITEDLKTLKFEN